MRALQLGTTENSLQYLSDAPAPECGDDEVTLEVDLAGFCGSDKHWLRKDSGFVLPNPQIIGHEILARIVATGKNVRNIRSGVRVVPQVFFSNGDKLGFNKPGGFAQYLTVLNEDLLIVDSALTDKLAILIEPTAVGVHGCQMAEVDRRDDVIVFGDGPIGLLASFYASTLQAEVTHVVKAGEKRARPQIAKDFACATVVEWDGEQNLGSLLGGKKKWKILECSGSPQVRHQLDNFCERNSTFVQIGMFGAPLSHNANLAMRLTLTKLDLAGADLRVAHYYAAQGALTRHGYKIPQSLTTTVPISEALSALEDLKGGKIGKLLFDPSC